MGHGLFFLNYRPTLAGHLTTSDAWRERLQALARFVEPPEGEVVVCRMGTGAPIGTMCLTGIDSINGKAELSVGFLRGRGTRGIWEAIHAALYYSFESLKLRKLICYALSGNSQALTMLEQSGATAEGVLVSELIMPGGEYADLRRYAMFRDRDWPRVQTVLARVAPLTHSSQ